MLVMEPYLCDCEQSLPFAVPTVWFCYFCGETHERVTNCACGKCVEFYGTKCDGGPS